MPLNDILKRIQEAAEAEAAAITAEAEDKARAVIEKAVAEASDIKAKKTDELLSRVARDQSIAVSRAETERRQAVLREKQRLVSEVFDAARFDLVSMPDGDYRAFLIDAISRNVEGPTDVLLGPGDEGRLGHSFEGDLQEAIRAAGKPFSVSVKYDGDVAGGGFVLKQGGLSDNFTFPAILGKIRDDLEIEVARSLFTESR